MGWVDSLRGTVVGLDTAPLIAFIEEQPVNVKVLRPFFRAVQNYEISLVTSTVTLLEVLVHPIRHGDVKLVQKYRDILFDSVGFTTIDLNPEIAEEAARLRAFHKIRTPDSIQMAIAIQMNATYFLTNDLRLPSLLELKILTLDELKSRPEYLTPDDLH
jgi:predicted nucleic acid-binding protein